MMENGGITIKGQNIVSSAKAERTWSAYDECIDKFANEVVASIKEDRTNTKRVIMATVAATEQVQIQNAQVIRVCERELSRTDLPEKKRAELIETMCKVAESTAYESEACRKFQEEQLNNSHKMPWKVLGWSVLVLFGGVGGIAIYKAVS